VKGNLHLFREALPTFKTNPDGGAFIITSSTAVMTEGNGCNYFKMLTIARVFPPLEAVWHILSQKLQVNSLSTFRVPPVV